MLLEQLKANQGKVIVIELMNSRVLSGKVVSVDNHYLKLDTAEGITNQLTIEEYHLLVEAENV